MNTIVKKILILVVFLLFITPQYVSALLLYKNWEANQSLLDFIAKHSLPRYIYFNLSPRDKELCDEIVNNTPYQILYDINGKLSQVLIPINEELQLHIYQESDTRYTLDIVPIIYDKSINETISIKLRYNAYYDIVDATNNQELANEFMRVFNGVNFKKLNANDILSIKFIQKIRMDEYYGAPNIIAASIKGEYISKYVFKNPKDDKYYDVKAKSISSLFFTKPLAYSRITSRFTKKRWHPILKKYRAHHGTDYGAKKGTRVRTIANGKVIFRGNMGGYGKTIIIKHTNNYKSLYAHLSRFAFAKKKHFVRQGQIIGYVGSSGLSTGAHLHLGIYKYSRAINPQKVLKSTTKQLKSKNKIEFLKIIKPLKNELDINYYQAFKRPTKLLSFKKFYTKDEIKFWIER